jgi:hypothetical protein
MSMVSAWAILAGAGAPCAKSVSVPFMPAMASRASAVRRSVAGFGTSFATIAMVCTGAGAAETFDGGTIFATSLVCVKFAGDTSPGATITRVPIRVHVQSRAANSFGRRMQPCEAA